MPQKLTDSRATVNNRFLTPLFVLYSSQRSLCTFAPLRETFRRRAGTYWATLSDNSRCRFVAWRTSLTLEFTTFSPTRGGQKERQLSPPREFSPRRQDASHLQPTTCEDDAKSSADKTRKASSARVICRTSSATQLTKRSRARWRRRRLALRVAELLLEDLGVVSSQLGWSASTGHGLPRSQTPSRDCVSL